MTIDHITAISALAAAFGVGTVVQVLAKAITQAITGRHVKEQNAWRQRDQQARARRMLEEYAHVLRGQLMARGVPVDELPTWPDYRGDA